MSNTILDIISNTTKFCNQMEIGSGVVTTDTLQHTLEMLCEEFEETDSALNDMTCFPANDQYKEDLIDGFGDIAFLAINGMYKTFRFLGDPHTEATLKTAESFLRITIANLGKLQPDGSVHKDDNGKIIKPEGWSPPTYKDLL